MLISGKPNLEMNTKALEKAYEPIGTINDKNARNKPLPRRCINKIFRALLDSVKPFITMTCFINSIPYNSPLQDIISMLSKDNQRILMKSKASYKSINPAKIYKDQTMTSSHDWWQINTQL